MYEITKHLITWGLSRH